MIARERGILRRWRGLQVRSAALAAGLSLPGCGEAPPPPPEPELLPSAFIAAGELLRTGRSADALTAYRALADSAERGGDSLVAWRARLQQAEALRRLGRMDSARAVLDVVASVAGDDSERLARVGIVRSQLLERTGDLDGALAIALETLDHARRARSPGLEANALNAIGTAYSLRGRYVEALAADSAALAIRRQMGDPPAVIAQLLNEVGIGYRHLGRHTDAARAYEEALELNRDAENGAVQAMLLYNLSNIRAATGDMDEAIRLLAAALALSERLEIARGIALTSHGLADRYLTAGNLTAARAHAVRALEANRGASFIYGEVLGLISLARIEVHSGAAAPALATATEALALADRDGFAKERAVLRALMGRAALLRGDAAAARRWTAAAVALADSIGEPETQMEAREAHALVLESLGHSDAAEAAYLAAIDLLESWRGRLEFGDLRMGVADERLGVYEGALRLRVQRGEAEAAFEIAERARARLLLELMADRDPRPGGAASETALLRQRLREAHEARGNAAAVDSGALERSITALTAELESAEAVARRTDPAAAAARYPRPAGIAELRSGLLRRPGRAVLAYFWGDEDVYGWWITDRSTRVARLGSADSLAPLVNFLRSAVERPGPVDWRKPAARAYDALLAPLDPEEHDEVLVLSDGPLTHLPLEVLIGASGSPWSRGRRIRYGPSASVLLALERAPDTPSWERAVLAVGNPALQRRAAAADSATRGDAGLPALPYAAEEARQIARLFRSGGADLLLGTRASVDRWMRLRPARYRYLHFAAHTLVDDRHPGRTRVLLAGGPLDLPAIRDLRLGTELVTLSGCETALGRRVRGEGVIGLPHAFLSAGARAVLVSLWPVRDQSAAGFMSAYYRELHGGRDPAAALLALRTRYMADPDTAHPSTWAGFVLVGAAGE